jgi:hypothetical protein
MTDDWLPAETSTQQEHVIAHVLGATALGYFTADEAAHFVLDIGFIWTILLDGAMGLVPYTMALAELNVSEEERTLISADVAVLYEADAAATLARITHAQEAGPLTAVEFYARAEGRRLRLCCEAADIYIETDFAAGAVEIRQTPGSADCAEAFEGGN